MDTYVMTDQELRNGQRVRVLSPGSLAGFLGTVMRRSIAPDAMPGHYVEVRLDADGITPSLGDTYRQFRDDALEEIHG